MGSLVGTGVIVERNITLEKNKAFSNATGRNTGTSQAVPLRTVQSSPSHIPVSASQPVRNPAPAVSTSRRGTTAQPANQVIYSPGTINPVNTGASPQNQSTQPSVMCPKILMPVVGASGQVYDNSCFAEAAGEPSWTAAGINGFGQGSSPAETVTETVTETVNTGSGGQSAWEQAWAGISGGGSGGYDMSSPMTEGPGMADYPIIAYDEQGNAIYGYSEDGTPIYGVDEKGNVINDPTKAKEAKAKELGQTPVYKSAARGFLFLAAMAAAAAYVFFKR